MRSAQWQILFPSLAQGKIVLGECAFSWLIFLAAAGSFYLLNIASFLSAPRIAGPTKEGEILDEEEEEESAHFLYAREAKAISPDIRKTCIYKMLLLHKEDLV